MSNTVITPAPMPMWLGYITGGYTAESGSYVQRPPRLAPLVGWSGDGLPVVCHPEGSIDVPLGIVKSRVLYGDLETATAQFDKWRSA